MQRVAKAVPFTDVVTSETPLYTIIYHYRCPDGTAAMVLLKQFFERYNVHCEYIGIAAGSRVPNCKGKNVIFADVTGSAADIERVDAECGTLKIIDHHKTALVSTNKVQAGRKFISMDYSGAMLTWMFLNGNREEKDLTGVISRGNFLVVPFTPADPGHAPDFIKYISDRDTWQNKLPNTAEVATCVEFWDFDESKYLEALGNGVDDLVAAGRYFNEYKMKQVVALARSAYLQFWEINGGLYAVNVLNSANFQSDVGNYLMKDKRCDFAAIWRTTNGKDYNWSFRSTDDRCDTLVVGKGHRNASGTQSVGMFPPGVKPTKYKIRDLRAKVVNGISSVIVDSLNPKVLNYLLIQVHRKRTIDGKSTFVTVAGDLLDLGVLNPPTTIIGYKLMNMANAITTALTLKLAIYGEHQEFCKQQGWPVQSGDVALFDFIGQLPEWF